MNRYYGFKQEGSFKTFSTKLAALLISFLAIFCFLLIAMPDFAGLWPQKLSENLKIDFINVGDGDAILIQTPAGKNYLIDSGACISPEEANILKVSRVEDYLRNLKIDKLDGILITHWHNNHFSGFLRIIRLYEVQTAYKITAKPVSNSDYFDYTELCKMKNIEKKHIAAGDILNWGEELFVQVLNPPTHRHKIDTTIEHHENSAVILLRYGKVQILLCSDITPDGQKELMKYGESLKSQIIKLPGHGRENTLFEPFLELVNPKKAIISAKLKEGLPYSITDSLENLGAEIYTTHNHGNISITVGGKTEEDYRLITNID
ncbi:MAG: MBL fold metallo-hydrolase [Candidatus Riflebacteria bacterium]|nr:MBL fold metallo-hydrolase [Candidatus Riflebacteria bacterium]